MTFRGSLREAFPSETCKSTDIFCQAKLGSVSDPVLRFQHDYPADFQPRTFPSNP
jgi:hypothetical protein